MTGIDHELETLAQQGDLASFCPHCHAALNVFDAETRRVWVGLDVEVGDVAYWPPGRALCIFWGPTPASRGPEPRAASPVNVFGKVQDRPKDLRDVEDGEAIRIERAEG